MAGQVVSATGSPPYDPMTPSMDDYRAAQKEVNLAVNHNRYLNTQTKDPGEKARGEAAFQAASKKLRDIKARMPKGTK